MKELTVTGKQRPDFIVEEELYFEESNPQKAFLPLIHHVDTYMRKDGLLRVNGYITLKDFLTMEADLPSELKSTDCNLMLKDVKPVIMIQSMLVYDDLPF